MSCNNAYKQNLKTMMAISSCRSGLGCVSNGRKQYLTNSYRSSNYNPDPRYKCQPSDISLITSEGCRELRNRQKQMLYNVPKKEEATGPKEWSDPSNSYKHKDVSHLFHNLEDPNARPPGTFYVCIECGCSHPEGSPPKRSNPSKSSCQKIGRENYKTDCRKAQESAKGDAEVTVYCLPEKITGNGSKIIYFSFRVNTDPNRPDPDSESPGDQNCYANSTIPNDVFGILSDEEDLYDDFKIGSSKRSPMLWWNCDKPGCLCSQIFTKSKPNGSPSVSKKAPSQTTSGISQSTCPVPHHTPSNGDKCTQMCVIRGENGEVIKIPCHHCFDGDGGQGSSQKSIRGARSQSCNYRAQKTDGDASVACLFKGQRNKSCGVKQSASVCSSSSSRKDNPVVVDRRQIKMNDDDCAEPGKRINRQTDNDQCDCGCLCHNFPQGIFNGDQEVSNREQRTSKCQVPRHGRNRV